MNSRTLEVLEFERVRRLLAEETSFGPGRDAALALSPSTDPAVVARRQRETTEARRLLDSGQSLPVGGLRDLRPLLAKAAGGEVLEPAEFLDIAQTCEGAGRLKRFLTERADRCPTLAEEAAALASFPELVELIRKCVNDRAEVSDSASRRLAEIRGGLRATLARVREKLEAIIHSPDYRKVLQDPVITLREERYVVPVRAEFREALPGVVHDRSASGMTLFVEPLSVVPLNNELKELALQERDEVARILRELTQAVFVRAAALGSVVQALGRLDLCLAKGRLSARLDAVEPVLVGPGEKAQLDFRRARHPLLKLPPPGRVVPIDVRVGRDFDTVVITGPNTGGKTVTLKTVGLLTLMALAGLHVPAAEGSRLSVFQGVWADIGDEQSIEQNLSTFSAHLRNIVDIVTALEKSGGENNLVLLDEIGAGTDPSEGAALAMALLEYLHSSGARTIATTHYSEIKAFVYQREGMINASVEFEAKTLAPTYRLVMGLPGKSNALEISRRLGLPEPILERARSLLRSDGRRDVPDLIQRLEEDRARVEVELEAAREASRRAREIEEQQARKWANLKAGQEQVLERAREEARAIIRSARLEAAAILGRLRETEAALAAMGSPGSPGSPVSPGTPGAAAGAAGAAGVPAAPDGVDGAPLPLESRRRLDRLEQAARDILREAEKRISARRPGAEGAGPAEPGLEPAVEGAAAGETSAGGRAGTAGVVPRTAEVRSGRTFYVAGLGHFGEVLEGPDEGGMVGLRVGAMRLTVHVSDLRVPGRGGVPEPPRAAASAPAAQAAAFAGLGAETGGKSGAVGGPASAAALSKALTVSPEIMLRGLTVEEALTRLEKYLDDALLAGLDRVRVIHGKGAGILRQAVAEYLDEHPHVRGHYLADPSEGGLGATIVLLGPARDDPGIRPA